MKRVMILNNYNLNNGDRAVLEATLQVLKENQIKNVTVSSFDVDNFTSSAENININVVPWGTKYNSKLDKILFRLLYKNFGMKQIKKYAKLIYNKTFLDAVYESDIILISGGHHLTDILGSELFYRLSFDMLYPLLTGKKVVLLPQTIGPIKGEEKNKCEIIKYIVNNSLSTAVRDESSKEFLRKINTNENYAILPDMVYGLYKAVNKKDKSIASNSIGIALYGNYTGKHSKAKIAKYLNELADAINKLGKSYSINFIPMEVKGATSDDRKIISYVRDRLDEGIQSNIIESKDVIEIIKAFSDNRFILAYKTHSVVFSILQSIPVVAIAYHKKSINFMEDCKLKEYAVWDSEATSENICNLIKKLEKNEKEIIKLQCEYGKEMYSKLNKFVSDVLTEML